MECVKLSPKHRALAAVLFLGALAIGVDRFVLGGATAPSAASASEFLPEGAVASPATAPKPASTGGVYALASARLEAARARLDGTTPDGFSLPPTLQPREALEPRASENTGKLGEDLPLVRSVIPGRGAMLGNEFVALGHKSTTGLTLVSVDAQGVVVEREGQRQRLELQRRSLRSVRMAPSGDSQ